MHLPLLPLPRQHHQPVNTWTDVKVHEHETGAVIAQVHTSSGWDSAAIFGHERFQCPTCHHRRTSLHSLIIEAVRFTMCRQCWTDPVRALKKAYEPLRNG